MVEKIRADAAPSKQSKRVWGVSALCFLLPLVYFPGLIQLYNLPKFTLLACLTTLLLWSWWLHSIRWEAAQPLILPLFLPLLFALLAHILSLSRAINPYEGVFHVLVLVLGIALFWLVVHHVHAQTLLALFFWIAVAGGMVAVLGILQTWGIDLPSLIPTGGPGATFGNKNHAAQYLLLALPVTFHLLLSTAAGRREWLYAGLAALVSTYFIYTGTRAAWGGGTVALLLLWCALRASGARPQELLSCSTRKRLFLAGIGVFVVAMNVIPPRLLPNFGSPAPSRFQSMLELEKDPSAQVRFALWANTLAIFQDHPLVGVGTGNFEFIYPLYHRRVITDPSFQETERALQAHNDYAQLLAEVGLVGTGGLLWMLLLLAQRFWRCLKDTRHPQILPIGFALTALLLEAFWDFPFALPVPTAHFWIYAGLLCSATQGSVAVPGLRPSRKVALGILAVLTASATVTCIVTLSHLAAEFYYSRFYFNQVTEGIHEMETLKHKLRQAESDLTRAVKIYPFDYRYHYYRAVLMLQKDAPDEALQANLRAVSLNPYLVQNLYNLGVIYLALSNPPKAILAFETALNIWPDFVRASNRLGWVYAKLGQRDRAIEQYRRSLEIDPENEVARQNLAVLVPEGFGAPPP